MLAAIPITRLMRFLFVRSRVCLQLPSDSPSPGTPLLFGYALPTTGCDWDFHPFDFTYAGRTHKKIAGTSVPAIFLPLQPMALWLFILGILQFSL